MIHKAIVLLLVGAGLVPLQAQEEDNLLKNPSAEITVANAGVLQIGARPL